MSSQKTGVKTKVSTGVSTEIGVNTGTQTQPPTYVVRNYKDTLFRMLFKEKDRLLSLYNAVNGTHYEKEEDLEIVTLENAIYMAMKNDIAFILALELHLYEHQSTFNPNLPLRDLIYITKEFEKLIHNQSIFASKQIKLPAPRFVVLYNGKEEEPEQQILKLSDLYEKEEVDPALELKVLMLNINSGKNTKLLEACKSLKEYTLYVEKVRKYAKEMKLEEAVEKAITESIREDILKEILLKYRSEVVAMSIFEYDEEREMRLFRKAEREYGIEEGIERGKSEGRIEGKIEGKIEGEQRMLRVVENMFADGLGEQVKRLAKEKDFLQEMLEKYQL